MCLGLVRNLGGPVRGGVTASETSALVSARASLVSGRRYPGVVARQEPKAVEGVSVDIEHSETEANGAG